MDNLTHTLFAVTLGRTALGRAGRGTTTALVLASNAPDIDFVSTARGAVSYLEWHRGPMHGPIGVIGLGAIVAGIVWLGRRMLDRRRPPGPDVAVASLPMLVAIAIVGALFHVLMDLPTPYGIRLLSPFDWHWYALDWMPIIDVYLIAVLAVGVVFGVAAPSSRRRVTTIVLVLVAANYGLRAFAHREALRIAPARFGSLLPRACESRPAAQGFLASWPRAQPAPVTVPGARPCLVEIAATPTLGSPLRWRAIARLSNGYELHDLNLADPGFFGSIDGGDAFWRRVVRYPDVWTPAVFNAATTRTGRVFLGFSRFPAARSFVDRDGIATVHWSDMRFAGGLFVMDEGARRRDLFSVLVRIGPDGRVLDEHMGR